MLTSNLSCYVGRWGDGRAFGAWDGAAVNLGSKSLHHELLIFRHFSQPLHFLVQCHNNSALHSSRFVFIFSLYKLDNPPHSNMAQPQQVRFREAFFANGTYDAWLDLWNAFSVLILVELCCRPCSHVNVLLQWQTVSSRSSMS